MREKYFAASIIIFSALIGAIISQGIPNIENQSLNQNLQQNSSSLVYGSTHKHALFYIVVNGTEIKLTENKFQLNSKYVHLENNNSHIVHKHAKGVTWKYFLETLNASIRKNQSQICLSLDEKRYCGKGKIILEGKENPDLKGKIKQGENLAILIGGNSTTKYYMRKQLPPLYKPEKNRGLRI